MSWFEYGTPRRRSLRKNVYLRVRDLPQNLHHIANEQMHEGEFIDRVKISEIKPKNKVLLEFWCRQYRDFDRYTVFYQVVDEDPNWICESDIGRGYKE